MNIWGITHRGVVREENQDAFAVHAMNQTQMLGVVCDGMGGARAGKVASTMALEAFNALFLELWNAGALTADKMLDSAAAHANESVHHRSTTDSNCFGMGTTMVAALVDGGHATILNVGDSRAYHVTPEKIAQVTRDHSLVEDLVLRGELTPEQARSHPHKNLITRALGAESDVRADLFELTVCEGEFFVLCSDGLSNVVDEQEILYEVLHGGLVEDCCQRLLDIAIKRGAPDNVTVVLLEC